MSLDMDFLYEIKRKAKYRLAPYPDLFIPVYRLVAPDRRRALLITEETKIVIEGFPRSGNTFAVVAFQHAQAKEVKIAHHLHVESQVLMGIRHKLPVLVLIREPFAAIRSLIIRHPEVKANFALQHYIRFYTLVGRLHNQIVIANFNEVTANFGKVITRVNEKFHTDFSIFQHTPENVQRVFQEIEQINQVVDIGKETHVARPSILRQKNYQELNISMAPALLKEAVLLYKYILHNKPLNSTLLDQR